MMTGPEAAACCERLRRERKQTTGEYEVVDCKGLLLNVCTVCGAVVYALGQHDRWHATAGLE